MKLRSIELMPFGAFENQRIDLSGSSNLTVIYGPNEAGKSTSLRAVETFFFGFEHPHRDAHRFPGPRLRVGATIETEGGEVYRWVRRSANREALRDLSDRPVDEALLRRMLGGVDRELYRMLYGVDQVRLREGSKLLLSGKTSFAENLFEATLAGAGVGKLARELIGEADEVFTARGRTKKLNEALRRLVEERRRSSIELLHRQAYEDQIQGIARAREERAEVEETLRGLDRKTRHVERARRVLPTIARLERAIARRTALGDVPPVTWGYPGERAELATEQERLRRTLSELLSSAPAAGNFTAPPWDPARAQRVVSEHLAAVKESVRIKEDLRRAVGVGAAEGALDPRALKKLRATLGQFERLREEHRRGQVERSRLVLQVEEAERLSGSLGPLDASVQIAIEQAILRLGELSRRKDERLRRLAAESGRAAEIELRAGELGSSVALERLATSPRPTETELREFAEEAKQLALRRRELEAEEARARSHAAELRLERELLLSEGPLPERAEIEAARRERDEAATDERRRELTERADQLADLLILHGSRATTRAKIDITLRSLGDRSLEIVRLLAELAAEERALWIRVEIGCRDIDLRPTSEGALRRLAELRGELGRAWPEWVAERAWLDEDRRDVEAAEALLRELVPGGVVAAEVRLRELHAQAQALGRAQESRGLAVALLREADARHRELEAELDATREAREAQLSTLGLPQDLDLALLDEIDASAARSREALRLSEQLTRETERGAVLLARLREALRAVSAGPVPEGDDVELLVFAERRQIELAAEERAEEEARRAAHASEVHRARVTEVQSRLEQIEARHAEMLAASGAKDLLELAALEERVALAAELDREARELTAQQDVLGEGAPIEEILGVEEGWDREDLEALHERLQEERRQLETARDHLTVRVQGLEVAAREMERRESEAASALERANMEVETVRSLALTVVRKRLAAHLLSREIEAYQRNHQGPVLAKTEEHFRFLTGGAFDGLRVVMDDRQKPELVCLRGTEEVGIEGLSDGARDQLYLALRLATIARHALGRPPVPLVLDDALIHFDEERALRALSLLGTLGMQVLFFTHHARFAELAAPFASIVTLPTES